jgi:GNAT superfamily N-acetyltransferase
VEGTAIDLSPPLGATDPRPSDPPSDREHALERPSSLGAHVKAASVGEAGRLTASAARTSTPSSPPTATPAAAEESSSRSGIDARPLGLWAAAGVHRRAFGRRSGGRLIAALGLLTPSWRVEHPNAVATLIARDPVSLTTWALLALGALVTWIVVAVFAALGSAVAMCTVPVGFVVALAAASGVLQRVSAWRTATGRRRALVVSNVATGPTGAGHGTALMAAIVHFADITGYDLVLLVDPVNEPALHLYRRFGFKTTTGRGRRVRMLRPPTDVPARLNPTPLPTWLQPIQWSAVTLGVAAVAASVLVLLYWGTPAAWLMPPIVILAGLAAENDLQTLRIPNRLIAAGAALMVLILVFAAVAFGAGIVAPATLGAAIFGAPLFANHALSQGRSGLGDAKLAAVLGLAVGALLVSMLLGSAFGAMWLRRHRGGVPLAPALAVGTTLVLVLWAVLEGPTTW